MIRKITKHEIVLVSGIPPNEIETFQIDLECGHQIISTAIGNFWTHANCIECEDQFERGEAWK